MNLVKGILFSLLRIFTVNALQIVSEEKEFTDQRSNDHIQHRPQGTARRFTDDLDDKDWHIKHLKNVDFDLNDDCKEENFTARVNKYRKSLKEDGSLVEYVSADALSVSQPELLENKCATRNQSTINTKPRMKKGNKNSYPVNAVNQTAKVEEINTATTADLNSTFKQKAKDQNATLEKARRTSEYQFSSDEYYDDVEDDIADDFCPDFVEVIELDMDQLRNYDVECELTLEWRSLE